MFEELSKHINKTVALLLKNGKEKKGRIVFLDSDDQTITFEDESTVAISFVKGITVGESLPKPQPVVAQVEPTPVVVSTPKQEEQPVPVVPVLPQEIIKEAEPEPTPEPEVPAVVVPQTPPEVIAKAQEIQQTYNNQITEVQLVLHAPELSGMPNEIKEIDGLGKSEEAKMWTNILNQYNDGVRHGKFLTDMDKIEKTLVHVKHLSQSPFLYAFVSIPQLLGYLSFMQGQKKEALEQIKHAVRIQDSPENAISLATIALDLGENELAFFTLKKLFLKINFTEEQYKIIWYKFLDLVIKIKAYNDFATIFGNKYRQLSPTEKQGVYEAVVFFLLQNRQRKDAEDLIQTALALEPNADIRYTALDALKKLGQPDREYDTEVQENTPKEEKQTQPQKEKINLPESRRNRPNLLDVNKPSSQYTFSSIILTLRDNYGFIKYGTNNLFFHAFDLANCQFAELSEGDQVEFKLKKGIKGSDVACEVKIMHAPKKKIEPNPATFTPKPFVPRVEAQPEKQELIQEPAQEEVQATTEEETQA